MANQEHLDILKEGVAVWNQWRQEHSEIQPDLLFANFNHANLVGANLSQTLLMGADFSFANLQNANLSKSSLRGVDFTVANLRDVNLSNTNLWETRFIRRGPGPADCTNTNFTNSDLGGVSLSNVYLSGANFNGAELGGVNFTNAKLDGADFTNAIFAGTIFGDRDLRVVKGLETVQHRFPSPVSINTIYLSKGSIPDVFLKGTGAPDVFVSYVHSLTSQAIEYHSCFISYSSKDTMLARRLYADLQVRGVRCWFAPEDMKIGDKIRPRIDEAIHRQDKLLLLLSKHSIQSSWVEDEVEAALEKEQQQQRDVLFPVRLDESMMQSSQAWAAKLRRTRHIGDFTRWTNPQEYQEAFERLLRDLKREPNTEEEIDGKPGTS